MRKVTLDSSVLPANVIREAVPADSFEFATVSVTGRESRGSSFVAELCALPEVQESAVWDESEWGRAVWGGTEDSQCLEKALNIISNGAFPKPGQRDNLSDGQRHQLRDAMILCAHVRDRRDIFVTNDTKAFVKDGRRQALEAALNTRIMTVQEFVTAFGSSTGGPAA